MAKQLVKAGVVRRGEKANNIEVEKAYSETVGPTIVAAQLFGRNEVSLPEGYNEYCGLYQSLAWVYASVFAVASGLAVVPWEIWDGEVGKGKKLNEEHEVVKLFNDPNDEMTWFDLIEATVTYLELAGDCYWEIVRPKISEQISKATGNPAGKPKQLFALRPSRVTIRPRKDGKGVEQYVWKLSPYSKNIIKFDPWQIVHFLYFNPMDDWYGLSPLSAAAMSVQSELYTIEYNQGFFQRDATPQGYLATDQVITPEQAKKIGNDWRKNLSGSNNKYKIPVMPKGLMFHTIGVNARDMQFLNQRMYNREEILSVFGVPPVKVGLLDKAKYDNYQLQEAAFYRDTIQPKGLKIASKITKFLRRAFNKPYTFTFDLSAFMTVDKSEEASRLLKLFSMGLFSPNALITMLKVGEVFEDGDEHYINSVYQKIGAGGFPADPDDSALMREDMNEEMEKLKAKVQKALVASEAANKSVVGVLDENGEMLGG